MRHKKRAVPQGAFPLEITACTHDGRGIGEVDAKKVFVDGALLGEQIDFVYTRDHKRYAEGRIQTVIKASPDRVPAPCPAFLICGGCSLQHMAPNSQINLKQNVLQEQLLHFGKVSPESWLPPLSAESFGYRRKARLGVRVVEKKGGVLIGFREKNTNYIALMEDCAILAPSIARLLPGLRTLINGLDGKLHIPQIEVAAGDDYCALIVRHMEALSAHDQQQWLEFFAANQVHGYLQPAGPTSVHKIYPETGPDRLYYELPDFQLSLAFHPLDFVQVNAALNQKMVRRALDLLEVTAQDRVLDLFCGLGNFTLPLARRAAYVVGVEGDVAMTERGLENAARNGITNVEFHAADLFQDFSAASWLNGDFNKLLIDPPRTGALEIVQNINLINPQRIVYVSCNPATLARDAGELCARGYSLISAGVMDMFPHTMHVESIAVFEKF